MHSTTSVNVNPTSVVTDVESVNQQGKLSKSSLFSKHYSSLFGTTPFSSKNEESERFLGGIKRQIFMVILLRHFIWSA